ncbi:MAG TPA: alpha/beta hydrolase, partial [Chryseosolibacter sp.]
MRLSLSVILLFAVNFICSAQKRVDKKEVLTIGGIRQLIWLKGADDTRPIFLFLHGGPGNSVMPYAQKFCDQLYKHFIVVHWDQRGAGETAKLNSECGPFTLRTFQDDAEQLVDSLLARLGRKTLFVAGHSWGTALGFHLVRTRPAQISAFIAIGAMVNQWESERIALKLMKAKAVRERDTTALNELNQIQIP